MMHTAVRQRKTSLSGGGFCCCIAVAKCFFLLQKGVKWQCAEQIHEFQKVNNN